MSILVETIVDMSYDVRTAVDGFQSKLPIPQGFFIQGDLQFEVTAYKDGADFDWSTITPVLSIVDRYTPDKTLLAMSSAVSIAGNVATFSISTNTTDMQAFLLNKESKQVLVEVSDAASGLTGEVYAHIVMTAVNRGFGDATGAQMPFYGLQGPIGPQGLQGLQGVQGYQGFQGTQGSVGGGVQGAQGFQGDFGPQGLQGVQGFQGFQGLIGAGVQGPDGAGGLQGNQGIEGTNGLQGDTGADGFQGSQGLKGDTGFQGAEGTDGLQGPKGDQGTQGAQGLKGDTGDQGFQGLKGDQGNQGFQGDEGTDGLQGSQGLKGDAGTDGLQGDTGTDGVQGYQGLKGDAGDQGVQGPQGLVGDTGSDGVQGFQGTGDDGPQGSQGFQGAGGGPQGSEGPQGFQGPLGSADNILYDSGVLTSAVQTITIPDSVMTGRTSCKIKIDHVITNGTTENVSLFVNSDTTSTNYNRQLIVGSGASVSGENDDDALCSTGAASSKAFTIVDVSVVGGTMMFSSLNSKTSGGAIQAFLLEGGKLTGTVTDLQGMTLVSTNANGFGIGSRVVVLDDELASSDTSGLRETRKVTGTDTALTTDDNLECDGTFTVTLYAMSGNAKRIFNAVNVGSGNITIDGNAAETIMSQLNWIIPPGQSVSLQVNVAEDNWILRG